MAVRHWGPSRHLFLRVAMSLCKWLFTGILLFSPADSSRIFSEKIIFFFWKSKNDSADGKISLVFRPFLLLALFLHLISAAITMIIGRPIYSLAFSDCIFSAPGGHFLRPPRLNIQRALYLIFLFLCFFAKIWR